MRQDTPANFVIATLSIMSRGIGYLVLTRRMNNDTSIEKICLVIHSLGIGGMERVMAELANNFAERDHIEVHLLLIGMKRNIEYPISDNIEVHRPDFKFRDYLRTIDTLRTMMFIRSKVKSIDPDTVLSFGELWNNLVLISLTGTNIPVFISDRSKPNKNLGSFQNYLRNNLYQRAAGFIAQTEEAKNVCIYNGWNENVRVIGNPIRKIPIDHSVEKENIVLTVGRLIKTKHIDQLIGIFHKIDQPGWKLVIVGGDAKKLTLSKKLQNLIEELGAGDKIFLEGQQNDVERYYNKSKIFAFTSSSEGYPNVIGEALSAGLPVVSYDCIAGPSDMIENGKNGFLIPLFDKEKFGEKLQNLMKDEELRLCLSKNATASIEKNETVQIANQFYSFISSSVQ